jgi:hypothetical protein
MLHARQRRPGDEDREPLGARGPRQSIVGGHGAAAAALLGDHHDAERAGTKRHASTTRRRARALDSRRSMSARSLVTMSAVRSTPLVGFMVRKESKGHGTNQYIEGPVRPGLSAEVTVHVSK